MLKLSSSGGYPGICGCMCDRCYSAVSENFCHTDSAYLCQNCNDFMHAANPVVLQHKQVVVCAACMNAPAAFTCQADAASLCVNCDIEIHLANPLEQRHKCVSIVPVPGLRCSSSPTYLEPFQDDIVVSIGKLAVEKEELVEDKTDSWLLLDLDSNDSQAMIQFNCIEEERSDPVKCLTGHHRDSGSSSICQIEPSESNEQQGEWQQIQEQQHQCQRKDVYQEVKGFIQDAEYTSMMNTKSELTAESETDCSFLLDLDYDDNQASEGYYQKEVDDYLDLTDYGSIAKEQQPQYPSDLWQDFTIHDGKNDSDHIVPVQSCAAQQHHPLQTYAHEVSERRRRWDFPSKLALLSFVIVQVLKKAYMPSNNGYFIKTMDAYPKPCGRDFPDPSLLMPMQFTAMNRAERVQRYKEKRKARKFKKKIRYTSRKVNTKNRPRVKGQFAN